MLNNFGSLNQAFRLLAEGLDRIDREVYEIYEKDYLEPIIGMGPETAEICIFGRDPGRQEVEQQVPFIGAGGQKVRRELYKHRYGLDMSDFEQSKAIGDTVFWANTVPYKPIGNKAWGERVKAQFKPLILCVLVEHWKGSKIITLGREAFLWFAIHQTKEEKQRIKKFWQLPERFENSLKVTLSTNDFTRIVELFPLPHPSPLNATWYSKFPGLLKNRLDQTGYGN
jgi:uracil-DNA glycosylase